MIRRPHGRLAAFLAALSLAAGVGPAAAAGPWRGQVVDAEHDRPLEGVVVLGVWDKLSPGMIHQRREFHDVDEVVTDAQGRFVIPARSRLTLNPLVTIDGPRLYVFKPGYGGPPLERGLPHNANIDDMRQLMEKTGVVFALKPARTLEERRRVLGAPPSGAPYAKIPRFMDAIDDEASHLGIEPLRKR